MSDERDGLKSEPFDSTHDVIAVGVDRVLARRLRAAEAGQVKRDARPTRARGESFPAGGGVEHAVEQDKRCSLARPAPHPQATLLGDDDVIDLASGHGIVSAPRDHERWTVAACLAVFAFSLGAAGCFAEALGLVASGEVLLLCAQGIGLGV